MTIEVLQRSHRRERAPSPPPAAAAASPATAAPQWRRPDSIGGVLASEAGGSAGGGVRETAFIALFLNGVRELSRARPTKDVPDAPCLGRPGLSRIRPRQGRRARPSNPPRPFERRPSSGSPFISQARSSEPGASRKRNGSAKQPADALCQRDSRLPMIIRASVPSRSRRPDIGCQSHQATRRETSGAKCKPKRQLFTASKAASGQVRKRI